MNSSTFVNLPEVSPAFIQRMAANASTATITAMMGRRSRTPIAWNASDPV
jgi:hypothetical protein